MRKFEIYQIGKVSPLTNVECKYYKVYDEDTIPNVRFYSNNNFTVALFFLNNIAGFKEMVGDEE